MNNHYLNKLIIFFATSFCLLACSHDNGTTENVERQTNKLHYNGIDISHHQGKIDWEKVSQDSLIQFVYIKATQGGSYIDPDYKKNFTRAQRCGLKCGSYHYFTMRSKAKDQFDNFKATTSKHVQDLIPVVDIELNGHDKKGWMIDGCHTGKNMAKERERVILTVSLLLDLFEKEYGCKPLLYCSYASYAQVIKGNFEDYPIFLGNYAKTPRFDTYQIWQYSDKGHIDGIEGYVDLDQFQDGVELKDIELTKTAPK